MHDTLHDLGHEVIVVGNRDHCTRCIINWHKADRKQMIDRGRCNPDMSGPAPPLCRDVPWVILVGKDMVFEGKSVHASHHLAWYRGILYCVRCGCYSETRVRLLGDKCRMKPSGTKAANGLRGIKEGLPPISGTPQAQTHDLPPSFVEEQAHDRDMVCPPLSIQQTMENQ